MKIDYQKSDNDNGASVIRNLIGLMGVKISRKTLAKINQSPNYPSLDSLANVLSDWNIENMGVRLSLAQLAEIPYPAIGHKPSEGKVTLDGTDLKFIHSGLWRQQFGTVMQDGYLFYDTIARNIALADEEIDRRKLLHAVKVAHIKDVIESLPLGYNTKIGANGVGLSQGKSSGCLLPMQCIKTRSLSF
jgi:ABC-type bacteriocin/lantibiotic exporter with double-glycine peptidase domain